MRNLLAMLALVVGSAVFPAAAFATEAPWRITEAFGVVRVVAPGSDATQAQLNRPLAVGSVVTTGAESRATIQNGAQRIVMSPNSRMTIAPDEQGMTRILQDLGALLFQVDHRQQPHFLVQTPLLAAVVKGTTFSVEADGVDDSVHVTQGLIEVRSLTGGAHMDVATGASAHVNREAPALVGAVMPPMAGTLPAGFQLPATDYYDASGGLLNADDHGAPDQTNAGQEGSDPLGTGDGGRTADLVNVAALLSVHDNGVANRNGNGNAGGNGNGNAGGNGNSNAGGNGNSNAGGNGKSNGRCPHC